MPVRATSARRITAPRSPAVIGARLPWNLPTAVRIGATMAARRMGDSLEVSSALAFPPPRFTGKLDARTLLPLREKVSPSATDEGAAPLAPCFKDGGGRGFPSSGATRHLLPQ